jgi:peptidoglycan/xylan/chitin deacetylase (PgdA/CDA1 family)
MTLKEVRLVIGWFMSFLLGLAPGSGVHIEEEKTPVTFYTQKVVVKGYKAQDEVQVLPLYQGLSWAVMTRWDDDLSPAADMTMSRLLDKYGYKGSFFLNSRGLGAETEGSLLGRGHSFGSHSSSHPVLPDCNYNRMFEELLGSRIALETRNNVPVNCFAVPGNHFVVAGKPGIEWDIYRLLLRSGYVQMAWPGHPPAGMDELSWNNELSGDNDKKTVEPVFSKIVNDKEIRQRDPNLSFSTHAWHYADKWPIIEEQLKSVARNKNFWYCTQAEYGAYRYQYRHAKIRNIVRHDNQLSFDLVRPSVIDAGVAVPLSITARGQRAGNLEIFVDGQKQSPDEITPASLVFSVPFPSQDQPPTTIDAVHAEGALIASRKFPFLKTNLSLDTQQKNLSLELVNMGQRLDNIIVTYRLAPAVSPGILRKEFSSLGQGRTLNDTVPLHGISRSVPFLAGQSMFTAQVDFVQKGRRQRLFIIRTSDLGVLKK